MFPSKSKICRFDGLLCEIACSCDGILSYGIGQTLFLSCSRMLIRRPICFYDGKLCMLSFSCSTDLVKSGFARCSRYGLVKNVEVGS